jgi:hypothetical protein
VAAPADTPGRAGPSDLIRVLLLPADFERPAFLAFGAAALALGVAGYFHGHLFHEGYAQVSVVGPLFFLNVIGTAAVILLLIRGLVLPFAAGALSISLGAIVSIIISHRSSFFGFAEAGYQTTALVILISEGLAVAFTLVGLWLSRQALILQLRSGEVAS